MRNQRIALLLLGLGLLAGRAYGQGGSGSDTPAVEISGSYSYLRTNLISPGGCCFGVNGGNGGVAFHFSRWFAVAGEIGGYEASDARGSGRSLVLTTYTVGPRLSLRTDSRLTPFAEGLVGGGHASGTLYTGAGGLGSNSAFVAMAGGGIDIRVSRRVAIRALQADYLFSKFKNGSNDRQNNLRLSGGIVFRFGSR